MNPMQFAALSHQGLVRSNNEDYYMLLPELSKHAAALIIADGMGGHNKGELASLIAVEYAGERLQQDINTLMSPKEIAETMVEIVEKANIRVYIESLASPSNKGMGTTLTLVVIMDDLLMLAHVGDCRLYRMHGSRFQLLTKDHTLSQELHNQVGSFADTGLNSPQRHMLTRALGVPAYMHADAYIYKIKKGDRLVLCTDGLYGYLAERDIHTIIREANTPQECAEDLINGALSKGGGDNVSVIVAFL